MFLPMEKRMALLVGCVFRIVFRFLRLPLEVPYWIRNKFRGLFTGNERKQQKLLSPLYLIFDCSKNGSLPT